MPDERTEEPTARRLQEAAAEGQSARSALLQVSLALSAALLASGGLEGIGLLWVGAFHGTAALLPTLNHHATLFADEYAPVAALWMPVLLRAGGGVALVVCASTLVALAQGNFKAARRALRPRWRQAGFSALARIVSRERWSDALIGLAAIATLVVELYQWLSKELIRWTNGLPFTLQALGTIADGKRLGWQIALTVALAGAVEFFQQKARHAARLRMTQREARDDRARSEAKPELKQRRRAISARRARSFRLAAIKRASALITNPQHVAVALRYAPPHVDVPTIVARGAERRVVAMREAARAYDVPIVQSEALARALYAGFDVDDEISEEHYAAVAAVFAWIVKTQGKLRSGDEAE